METKSSEKWKPVAVVGSLALAFVAGLIWFSSIPIEKVDRFARKYLP